MSTDIVQEAGVSLDDVTTGDPEAESSKFDLVVEVSSIGEMDGELGIAGEVLTAVQLDLARASDKLVNLSMLMMNVATKESDFEACTSAKGHLSVDFGKKALEFDLLSGILDSEVTELDKFLRTLQTNVVKIGEITYSQLHLGETFVEMGEKLRDFEESLKQSQDQVSEIKEQSAKFSRTLSCLFREENWNGNKGSNFLEDRHYFNNAKINMHTAEQQRHILRMLEKSLAREIDSEKKLTEARKLEDKLSHRLRSVEQELFLIEEEAVNVCERCYGAENTAEVFMGVSKELIGRVQILQFNLNVSIEQETELSSKLQKSVEQLEAKESALQKFNSSSAKLSEFLVAQTDSLKACLTQAEDKLILANSEVFTLGEKVSSLEKQLKESEQHNVSRSESEITEMENLIVDLKEKLSKADSRTASAEAKCALLTETNMELNEELGHFKDTFKKVDLLERQLKESDIELQYVVASSEASQEKLNILYSTIRDMENLIEDLKSKVLKAECRADSTEAKCIILSESNAELNEELSFLRGRLEQLEASLNQAEETKMAAAKDIGFQTKVITDLVMQLAIERECLHKKISSLTLENRALVLKLQQSKKDPFVDVNHQCKGSDENLLIPEDEKTQISSAVSKVYKNLKRESVGILPECGNVRAIDAEVLSFKHFMMTILVILISAAVYIFLPRWFA